jgi:hypothetical protein
VYTPSPTEFLKLLPCLWAAYVWWKGFCVAFLGFPKIDKLRCVAGLLLCAAPAFHPSYYRPLGILLLALCALYIFAKRALCCAFDFVIWFERLERND